MKMNDRIEETISMLLGESSISFDSDVVMQAELDDLKDYIEADMIEAATHILRMIAKRSGLKKSKERRRLFKR